MAKGGVPVVLDRVVTAAKQDVGDFGPAIVYGLLENEKNPVLFYGPRPLFAQGIQLVVPSLAALLSCPVIHPLRDQLPLVGSQLGNNLEEHCVLFVVPGALSRAPLIHLLLYHR